MNKTSTKPKVYFVDDDQERFFGAGGNFPTQKQGTDNVFFKDKDLERSLGTEGCISTPKQGTEEE